MLKAVAICAAICIAGCATPFTDAGQRVRIVTAEQKSACETIKLVTLNQRFGPDKPGNAMKSALNEAAAAGANGFYIVSTAADWAKGAAVVGEALRCSR